jgi:hypothetical protein
VRGFLIAGSTKVSITLETRNYRCPAIAYRQYRHHRLANIRQQQRVIAVAGTVLNPQTANLFTSRPLQLLQATTFLTKDINHTSHIAAKAAKPKSFPVITHPTSDGPNSIIVCYDMSSRWPGQAVGASRGMILAG